METPSLSLLDYSCMILYLAGITFVGIWVSRRKVDTEDFILAGGKTRTWIAAITHVMATASTLSLVGTPGEAYNHGLRLSFVNLIAPIAAFTMFTLFVRFYFMTKTFTPFSYLERRFDIRVRGIISVLYLFSRLSYIALVLFSCSAIFKGAAGWPPWLSVLVMSLVCMFYCTMGGFRAILWTNVIQFIVMWGGLVAAVTAASLAVEGGVPGAIRYAFQHGRGFEFGENFFSFSPYVRLTFWQVLYSAFFSYMFFVSTDQIALQPLLSTSSYVKARNSLMSSVFMMLPVTAILYFLGLAMFAFFSQNPVEGGNPSGDTALFYFTSQFMASPLPGLVVAAMLAAAVSTVASGFTGTASVITKDIYLRFLRPKASESNQVTVARISTVMVALFSTGVALLIVYSSQTLGETLVEASAIYIAIMCIVPTTFFIGVMNPRCNSNHALGAMFFGAILAISMVVWYMMSKFTDRPLSYMIVSIPGGIGTILFGLIVPFFFSKKSQSEKIIGLTLWTLKKEQKQIDLDKPLQDQITKM